MPVSSATEPGPTVLLKAAALTKRFGDFTALSDLTLSVNVGEVHCLLGENGAGKSTLCNLLCGAYVPTSGTMTLRGLAYGPATPREANESGVAMVHQHFSCVPSLSVLDNLVLGKSWLRMPRAATLRRAADLASRYRFDIDFEATASDLAVGALQQVEILKCLLAEPTLMILDEPTAVLTPDAIPGFLELLRRIADQGCAILLVTHKLKEVQSVADRVTVLRHGAMVDTGLIAQRSVDSFVASMIGASPQATAHAAFDPGLDLPRGADVLMLDGATVDDEAGRRCLEAVTLIVCQNEVVGIAGVEGNGQAELVQVLSGMATLSQGRAFVGRDELTRATLAQARRLGIATIPEDRHRDGCILELPLCHNLFLDRLDDFQRGFRLDRARLQQAALERMATYDIRATSPWQPFRSLSGGNQQKAVIARELEREDLRAVVAAQPTRGLDHGAVQFVYRSLQRAAARGAAVVILSSELDELMTYCHRIVVLFKGRIVGELRRAQFSKLAIGRMMAGVKA